MGLITELSEDIGGKLKKYYEEYERLKGEFSLTKLEKVL